MVDDEDNNIIDDEADADGLRRLDLPKEIVRRKVETADEAIGNNCSMLDDAAAAVVAVSTMPTTTKMRWDATFER